MCSGTQCHHVPLVSVHPGDYCRRLGFIPRDHPRYGPGRRSGGDDRLCHHIHGADADAWPGCRWFPGTGPGLAGKFHRPGAERRGAFAGAFLRSDGNQPTEKRRLPRPDQILSRAFDLAPVLGIFGDCGLFIGLLFRPARRRALCRERGSGHAAARHGDQFRDHLAWLYVRQLPDRALCPHGGPASYDDHRNGVFGARPDIGAWPDAGGICQCLDDLWPDLFRGFRQWPDPALGECRHPFGQAGTGRYRIGPRWRARHWWRRGSVGGYRLLPGHRAERLSADPDDVVFGDHVDLGHALYPPD